MTIAKLRIDLIQGQIEVEGSDELVREVYVDFRDRLQEAKPAPPQGKRKPEHKATPIKPAPKDQSTRRPRGKRRTSVTSGQPSIVRDLDLSGEEQNVDRLKDFFDSFNVKSNLERNLVFIYYLEKKIEVSPITPNHVFTCYRDVGAKVPTALVQSLRDTANRYGWIDTSDTNDLKITVHGINHLEHDLAKTRSE